MSGSAFLQRVVPRNCVSRRPLRPGHVGFCEPVRHIGSANRLLQPCTRTGASSLPLAAHRVLSRSRELT